MSMEMINRLLLLSFMIVTAFQDLKTKSVSTWIFWSVGGAELVLGWMNGSFAEAGLLERAGSMGIGVLLLALARLSGGSIGEGDGCFLLITGMVFGFWNNLALLLYGLLFCSCFSLGLVLWGFVLHVDMRKKTVPFLPFLLPAGIWMVML